MKMRREGGVQRARTAPAPATRATFAYTCRLLRGEVFVYERLASTNVSVRELAQQGACQGVVVIADEQQAGRGRHGRSWHSPRGAGFYGSILLRPDVPPQVAPLIPLVVSIAVAEALESLGASGFEIKWPNDVLLDGRKIAGILTESGSVDGKIDWVVVGIGVNLLSEAVPPELADRATSLEEQGILLENLDLIDPLLKALDHWYRALLDLETDRIVDRWRELAPMALDREVRVDDGTEIYTAVTDGVTPEGLLWVRRGDGRRQALSAAEVTLSA